MLYVSYTQSTSVCVTLYEKCSNVTNPYFTWVLTDKDRNDKYYLYMDDNSNSPFYYNTFTFSGGLTASQYKYEVYEMASANDLDINNAIRLVENGLLNVIGTYSVIQSYTESNNKTNVYTNQNRI